jgi:hypothetical protein
MKKQQIFALMSILCVAGIVAAWFRPAYETHLLLREFKTFRPGITMLSQVEVLERRGLIRKGGDYCAWIRNSSDPETAHLACYSFMFRNTLPAMLHLAPPAGVYGSVIVKQKSLVLIQTTLQEEGLAYRIDDAGCELCTAHSSPYYIDRHLDGVAGVPGNALVQLTRNSSEQQRRDAYAVNVGLLVKIGEVRDGRDLNKTIWK